MVAPHSPRGLPAGPALTCPAIPAPHSLAAMPFSGAVKVAACCLPRAVVCCCGLLWHAVCYLLPQCCASSPHIRPSIQALVPPPPSAPSPRSSLAPSLALPAPAPACSPQCAHLERRGLQQRLPLPVHAPGGQCVLPCPGPALPCLPLPCLPLPDEERGCSHPSPLQCTFTVARPALFVRLCYAISKSCPSHCWPAYVQDLLAKDGRGNIVKFSGV